MWRVCYQQDLPRIVFISVQAVSWYGLGAGLQYLALTSHQPTGWAGTIVGVTVMVSMLMVVGGFAWIRRLEVEAWLQRKREGMKESNRAVAFRTDYKTQQSQQALIDEGMMKGDPVE